RRRLAGAVGAEEAVDLSRFHVQADAVDGRELPVRLDEIVDGDHFAHAQQVLRERAGMAIGPRSAGAPGGTVAPARIRRDPGSTSSSSTAIFRRPIRGSMAVCFSSPPRARRTCVASAGNSL